MNKTQVNIPKNASNGTHIGDHTRDVGLGFVVGIEVLILVGRDVPKLEMMHIETSNSCRNAELALKHHIKPGSQSLVFLAGKPGTEEKQKQCCGNRIFHAQPDAAQAKMVACKIGQAALLLRPQLQPTNMKYLITGLGNVGYEYDDTRHNIGFEVVDALCKSLNGEWKVNHHGDLAEVKFKGRILLLLKPNTYMNLSGKAVRYWLQKEKIPVENSLTVLDDLNLDFGKQRLRAKGSDGGHNGLKNIQELLATDAYPRLRIGIGSSFSKGKQVNYVLGKWTEDEKAELPRILEKAEEVIKTFVTLGLERAMNTTGK